MAMYDMNPNGKQDRVNEMKNQINTYIVELADAFTVLADNYTGTSNQRKQMDAYNLTLKVLYQCRAALTDLAAAVAEA